MGDREGHWWEGLAIVPAEPDPEIVQQLQTLERSLRVVTAGGAEPTACERVPVVVDLCSDTEQQQQQQQQPAEPVSSQGSSRSSSQEHQALQTDQEEAVIRPQQPQHHLGEREYLERRAWLAAQRLRAVNQERERVERLRRRQERAAELARQQAEAAEATAAQRQAKRRKEHIPTRSQ